GAPAPAETPWDPPPPPQAGALGALAYSGGTAEDQPSAYGAPGEPTGEEPAFVQQRRVDEHEQLRRNDPCWCGSGKKVKKCHGACATTRPQGSRRWEQSPRGRLIRARRSADAPRGAGGA